jgi:hypothetical protein
MRTGLAIGVALVLAGCASDRGEIGGGGGTDTGGGDVFEDVGPEDVGGGDVSEDAVPLDGADAGLPECDGASASGTSVWACVWSAEDGAEVPARFEGQGEPLNVSGSIVEAGTGALPAPAVCASALIGGESTRWAVIDDGESTWTLAWAGPDLPGAPAVGAAVDATFQAIVHGFAPFELVLELRESDGGELLVWVGVAGTPETLEPPDAFTFATGEALCEVVSECGTWRSYALEYSTPAASGSLLPQGSVVTGDGWSVSSDEVSASVSGTQCTDWFVAATGVVLSRALE